MSGNYIIPLFVAGTLVLVLFAFFLIGFLVVQKYKQNEYQLEKQKMIYTHQNQILRTRLDVHEDSMNQISKEIHDNIGQLLGLIQMHMHSLSRMATNDREATLIGNINGLVGKAITDIRNLSHSMSSDMIKRLGLVAVLKNELDYVGLSQSIECVVELKNTYQPLSTEKELLIYRIAQEAIHNTIKHAQASVIKLALNFDHPDRFCMSISDNGKGFDKDVMHPSSGLGLINMYERAAVLNGNLNIDSHPNSGSIITLTIDNPYEYGDDN